MEFTDFFQHTGACRISPDGTLVATGNEHKLIIRDTETLKITLMQTCDDKIEDIEWSCDSMYVLCVMYKRALVQVFSATDSSWTCKIQHHRQGLAAAIWSPDGRHILTADESILKVNIWSLVSQHSYHIKIPKFAPRSSDFSHDGKYLCVLERKESKDFVSVLACDTWQLVRHFPIETEDAQGVAWAPDDSVICFWDSNLFYKVVIHSLDGKCLGSYSAYSHALGVKTTAFSPSSQLLAIGSYDQKVRLLNNITWKKVSEQLHPPILEPSSALTGSTTASSRPFVLYLETEESVEDEARTKESFLHTGGVHRLQRIYQIKTDFPHTVPCTALDPEKPNPKMGVGFASFSPDSRFLATRNDNMPNLVWIWDIVKLRLFVVLQQMAPVREAVWHPRENKLAICTRGNHVYFWTERGASCIQVPTKDKIAIQSLVWNFDGSSLLILDKDRFCTANISPDAF